MPFEYVKKKTDKILRKILPRSKVNPLTLTLISVIFKFITLALIFLSFLKLALIALIIEVLFDILDGYYARKNKQTTKIGGLLDHSADFLIRPLYVFALLQTSIINPFAAGLFIFTYMGSILFDFIKSHYSLKTVNIPAAGPIILLALGIILSHFPILILLAIIYNTLTIIIKLLGIFLKN